MSRKPCLSCWRIGRSVRGTEAVGDIVEGRVAAEERVADEAADEDVTVLALIVGAETDGFMAEVALDDALVAVAVGLGTAFTGRGCDIGVS